MAKISKSCDIVPQFFFEVLGNADGLLGDAHDAAHGLIVHAYFVEDEEESVEGYLLIIRKSRGARWSFLERSEKHLRIIVYFC